ncbi:unnamed protein product [Cylindrotheca closterium]|uniref:Uncharacterized protein n=1 Tax=Cylindrotheca closterium TaxID=2856 RepID=A0AAD2FDN6_9STRA|nr:unnamed protein product [Cylindrotheca closterium]
MNHQSAEALITKNTKSDYETRFLLQSRSHSPTRSPTAPKATSRVINLMGGEDVLDFLTIYFAERIAEDDLLSTIYCQQGGINRKELVHLQKELLLVALADDLSELTSGPKADVYNQAILQKHVRLGIMEKEEYFDRLAAHLANSLTACQIKEERAIIKTKNRFGALRPLLQITHQHLLQH